MTPTIEHFPVPNFLTTGGPSAALRDPCALCHPQPFRLPPCHPWTGESPAADAVWLGRVGTAATATATWMGGGASGLQLLGSWEVWGCGRFLKRRIPKTIGFNSEMVQF